MTRLLAKWKVRLVAIVLFVSLLCLSPNSVASASANGAAIFQANCAGCHPNGGNIVRRGKTLRQQALRRNGMDSLAAIKTLVRQGKNNMPAYADRLSSQEIEAVATYVLERAKQGWR